MLQGLEEDPPGSLRQKWGHSTDLPNSSLPTQDLSAFSVPQRTHSQSHSTLIQEPAHLAFYFRWASLISITTQGGKEKKKKKLLMSCLYLILREHASNYWSVAEEELCSVANSSFFTVDGGAEGIVANIWNMLPLIVLWDDAALKLHRFIQSWAGQGREHK